MVCKGEIGTGDDGVGQQEFCQKLIAFAPALDKVVYNGLTGVCQTIGFGGCFRDGWVSVMGSEIGDGVFIWVGLGDELKD